jgi:hypothetical protein
MLTSIVIPALATIIPAKAGTREGSPLGNPRVAQIYERQN